MKKYKYRFKQPKDNTIYTYIGTPAEFVVCYPNARIVEQEPQDWWDTHVIVDGLPKEVADKLKQKLKNQL